MQARRLDRDDERAEQHPARRHLVDERIQPVDEQQLVVGRLAGDAEPHAPAARDSRSVTTPVSASAICSNAGLFGRPDSAHADVGAMREVLPRVANGGVHTRSHVHAAWTSIFFACFSAAMAAVTRSKPSRVLGGDGLRIDRRRKLDGTKQLAGLKLAHVHDALRLPMGVRGVSLDEQRIAGHLNIELMRLHAGECHLNDKLIVFLADFNRRFPDGLPLGSEPIVQRGPQRGSTIRETVRRRAR